MENTQALPAYPRGLDFEQVWAALMENREQIKETDRLLKETAERQKKTDRQIKNVNKRFGEFTSRFGEVVEYMVAPNLREKFREIGLVFNVASSPSKFYGDKKEVLFEVDVLLQNGDKAMLVEVKTKLSTDDVNEHIERLEKMRAYADAHGDKRSFLGAVAGVVMPDNVKNYALKKGFFVIEPSGETFNITHPNRKPKEW